MLGGFGIRFIRILKNATRKCPTEFLYRIEVSNRGQIVYMKHKCPTGDPDIMALMWLDRGRRYFISIVGTSLPGHTIYREGRRKDGIESRRVTMEIEIPEAAEIYYQVCF